MINRFKQALRAKTPQIGLWLALADGYSAELLAGAGFHWLLIDGEHAPNDLRTVLHQLQAIASSGTHPVVRPAWNDAVLIKQLLDIGAQTLLVPMIQSAAEAQAAVSACRYPPRGMRGVGSALARASQWGRIKDYLSRADEQICLLVQIETRRGIERLDEILAVPGVDGVFIGPADLSADMGFAGQPQHPQVQDAIRQAMAKIRSARRAPGILMADEALADSYLQQGGLFVAVGTDVTLLARSAEALAARFIPPPTAVIGHSP